MKKFFNKITDTYHGYMVWAFMQYGGVLISTWEWPGPGQLIAQVTVFALLSTAFIDAKKSETRVMLAGAILIIAGAMVLDIKYGVLPACVFATAHIPNRFLMKVTAATGLVVFATFETVFSNSGDVAWYLWLAVIPIHALVGRLMKRYGIEMRVLGAHPDW